MAGLALAVHHELLGREPQPASGTSPATEAGAR
jgi:hypothetical protein